MKASKEKRLGAGRVAFLARVEVFKEKINSGHTMAMVYEEYQNQLGISYSQFVNYVNRYIKGKQEDRKTEEKQPEKVTKERQEKDKFVINPNIKNEDMY